MAYGLDVEDLIYTDANLNEIGTLEDHEVDLDVAGEKNFELRSDFHIMELGSLWYVDGTEFGGIVGKFETDPDNNQVIYTGRSFRGILASKIIEVEEGLNVETYSGSITTIVNNLLEEYDLNSFFVCDNPDTIDGFDEATSVDDVDILSGTTLYDAMMKIANSINYTFLFEYNAKEKRVHIIPCMVQNWIDLMAYNKDNAIKFKSSLFGDFINHLVCSGIDEKGKRRTIHLFLNENGELQPYANTDKPLKDSDYILDKSKKVVGGIREIVDYYETQISVENNYEPLTSQPSDWSIYFGNYYRLVDSISIGSYEPRKIESSRILTFSDYVTLESIDIVQGEENRRKHLTPGTDWNLYQPETVVIFSFMDDYKNWAVKINGRSYTVGGDATIELPSSSVTGEVTVMSEAKKVLFSYSSDVLEAGYDYNISEPITRSKKIQLSSAFSNKEYVSVATRSAGEENYEAVKAVENPVWVLKTIKESDDWNHNYSYYYKRSWDQAAGDYKYSNYSAETEPDMSTLKRIKEKPSDWAYNFGQYYYKFYNGRTTELKSWEGKTKYKYHVLKGKPDDWNTNFSSYYRIAYLVTYTEHGKKKTTVRYSVKDAKKVSGYKSRKQFYEAVKERKKKKGEKHYHKWPTWKKHKYYSRESISYAPNWKKYHCARNCYLPKTKYVVPDYEPGNCFERKVTASAPAFANKDAKGRSVFYRSVEDHYAGLVRSGSDTLLNQDVSDSYEVTVDDYEFNIGDIVGGEDEVTGLNLPQVISNKIIKITKGVVYVDYEIGGDNGFNNR